MVSRTYYLPKDKGHFRKCLLFFLFRYIYYLKNNVPIELWDGKRCNMLKQRKVSQAKRIALKLSDKSISYWLRFFQEEIASGYEYVYKLNMKGKSSYKKLDELMESIYDMETVNSILQDEFARRCGFCSLAEDGE